MVYISWYFLPFPPKVFQLPNIRTPSFLCFSFQELLSPIISKDFKHFDVNSEEGNLVQQQDYFTIIFCSISMSLPPRVDQGYAQQGTSLSNIPSRRHSKTNSRSSDSNINGNGADIQNNSQNAQNINTVNLPKSGSASTTGGCSTDFVSPNFIFHFI